MKKVISSFLFLFLIASHTHALWQPLGSGLTDRVYAVVEHNNELYAGGVFPGLISKWDGVNWVTVGAGLTGTSVRALISFNGDLYAAGVFTVSGNSGNIAKWNGTNWDTVGDGLGGVMGSGVMCLYAWNGVLYAGGTFSQSGVTSVARVAKLVNGSWQQVGAGAPQYCSAGVFAMTVYNSELYVGGQGSAPWINKLDFFTSNWTTAALGGLTQGVGIYALAPFHYPNQSTMSLFVGGDFSFPFSICCTIYSGSWGSAFNAFSSGATDQVNAFYSTGDHIYAGGVFTVTGSNTATNLAKKGLVGPWDTVGVASIDGGIDALGIFQGYLVCAGNFTNTNGITMNHVMINDGVYVSTNEPTKNSSPEFFPNPVHTTLHYSPEQSHCVRQLTIVDATGKSVLETEIEKECDVSLRDLKSGIYFYSIEEKGRKISEGKVVVE